jgi:hypothetical protein
MDLRNPLASATSANTTRAVAFWAMFCGNQRSHAMGAEPDRVGEDNVENEAKRFAKMEGQECRVRVDEHRLQ